MGPVLGTLAERLLRCTLFFEAGSGRKMVGIGQPMMSKKYESFCQWAGSCSAVRRPDWGPRDPLKQWLETFDDAAQFCNQWRPRIRKICSYL